MFINAARTLRVHCVDGITANADVCQPLRRVQHRHGHGAEPGHRLRQVDRARRRGDEDGPGHPGADPREEGPDRRADREGPRPGRDDGAGRPGHESPGARSRDTPGGGRRHARSARARRRAGDRRLAVRSPATWTALGATADPSRPRASRAASIVNLTGPLVITSGEGLGRGLLGEVIGFDDGGRLLAGRAVFTDEHGDRIFCALRGRADRDRPPRHRHDHGRHGSLRGARGELHLRLAVRRGRRRAARSSGRAVERRGAYAACVGPPAAAAHDAACEDPASLGWASSASARRSGSGRCPRA